MNIQFSIFVIGVMAIIYGLFGTPTPDGFGVVEAAVGLCLVMAVGLTGAWRALRYRADDVLWVNAGRVSLVFGVSIPVIVGAVMGAGYAGIARDGVPFLFMMLPVFLVGVLKNSDERELSLVVMAVVFIGTAFSGRELWGSDPLYYLANMPSVLMAGIFFAGTAVTVCVERFSVRALGIAVMLGVLACAVMWPVVVTQQRASVGAFVLAVVLIMARLLWLYPKRVAVLVVPLVLAVIMAVPAVSEVVAGMVRKSDVVGFNMRFEELAAVWAEISARPLSLVFGLGWGGQFESPAVADIRVNFTHSMVSSVLLKTGLLGVVFTGLYFYGLARLWWSHALAQPVLALAVGLPIVIDVFLYASFKSLDFGLVLLVVCVMAERGRFKSEGKAASAIAS
jgi:type IV secretory pathway VirB3-like protein